MKCLPVIYMLFFACHSSAQVVPDSATRSSKQFAAYLQSTYHEPSDQINILYNWITGNIRYDTDSSMFFNYTSPHEDKIAATLRRKKGVCENYASLMADIAAKLRIPAFVVHGYPANANPAKDNSHSWVAIQDKNEWYLCDPTWDAQNRSMRYYMVAPEAFINTHIPFDPMWQLLEHPLHYKNGKEKFMYKDSVAHFLQLDSMQQYIASERRIKNVANQNSMTKNWQGYTKMNIAIIAGEKDEQLYNEAVELLNKANKIYNTFVEYRNNRFAPLKTDESISAMLQPIPQLLKQSENKLKQLGREQEDFQYNPEMLLQRIASLKIKTGEQQKFLELYISTAFNERLKLF